jgi:hypothetical protein
MEYNWICRKLNLEQTSLACLSYHFPLKHPYDAFKLRTHQN